MNEMASRLRYAVSTWWKMAAVDPALLSDEEVEKEVRDEAKKYSKEGTGEATEAEIQQAIQALLKRY